MFTLVRTCILVNQGGISLKINRQMSYNECAKGKRIMRSVLREKLAELCHSQWSGWMNYLFSKCTSNDDGSLTIPPWAVARWTRQMSTDYEKLSDDEKNTDREEADKFLALLESKKNK